MKVALSVTAVLISIVLICAIPSCHENADKQRYSTDTVVLHRGEMLFGKNCSSCHNFIYDDIAPQLGNITGHQSFQWITSFIRNPSEKIKSGDSTAAKLVAQYKTIMPSFSSLPEQDLTALVSYIHSQKQPEQAEEKSDTNDLKDPIPDTIANSDLVVRVRPFVQMPKSSNDTPLARITKLDYIPQPSEMYVVDLNGKLYRIHDGKPEEYMDMAKLRPAFIHQPGMATGFGSFAFHPDFLTNGLLYTTHAEAPGSGNADFKYDSMPVQLQWVLTEWKTTPGTYPFKGTSRELMRINMPTPMHGMQEIAFHKNASKGDPDYGLLYIGVGDGGSTTVGHPLASAHPRRIWGSILRIDPSKNNSANKQYGIPSLNPFADSAGLAGEVYAYGFRNPHRITWDKAGKLFAVNIGEHSIESVNLIEPGHFYGWPIREGTFLERFSNKNGHVYPLPADDSVYHVTYPVVELDHGEATAITGAYEYEGSAVPELKGKLVFGDIGTGKLFYIRAADVKQGKQATIKKWNISLNGKPTSPAELCGRSRVDMRLAMDSRGELYILTKADGRIYKLVGGKK